MHAHTKYVKKYAHDHTKCVRNYPWPVVRLAEVPTTLAGPACICMYLYVFKVEQDV